MTWLVVVAKRKKHDLGIIDYFEFDWISYLHPAWLPSVGWLRVTWETQADVGRGSPADRGSGRHRGDRG